MNDVILFHALALAWPGFTVNHIVDKLHQIFPKVIITFKTRRRVPPASRQVVVRHFLGPTVDIFGFQDHVNDLLRVQPADPEPSGVPGMEGWERLGRPCARTGGGVYFEATTR